ncbi:hypothetical protein [Candidatus Thiothrix anitrata]|uniref:Uncharacterized protein n=1 Tax=Candidatus Thiothrix anitrata TaxID=2823902 RepID=A0ABX7X5W6_9GAMM|nr:hypothetical protein [Candidatus Thiothrix anitrata]QTR51016.1 hypothetical protein J8380_05490 [Candidatus Thiothrix anitrata]
MSVNPSRNMTVLFVGSSSSEDYTVSKLINVLESMAFSRLEKLPYHQDQSPFSLVFQDKEKDITLSFFITDGCDDAHNQVFKKGNSADYDIIISVVKDDCFTKSFYYRILEQRANAEMALENLVIFFKDFYKKGDSIGITYDHNRKTITIVSKNWNAIATTVEQYLFKESCAFIGWTFDDRMNSLQKEFEQLFPLTPIIKASDDTESKAHLAIFLIKEDYPVELFFEQASAYDNRIFVYRDASSKTIFHQKVTEYKQSNVLDEKIISQLQRSMDMSTIDSVAQVLLSAHDKLNAISAVNGMTKSQLIDYLSSKDSVMSNKDETVINNFNLNNSVFTNANFGGENTINQSNFTTKTSHITDSEDWRNLQVAIRAMSSENKIKEQALAELSEIKTLLEKLETQGLDSNGKIRLRSILASSKKTFESLKIVKDGVTNVGWAVEKLQPMFDSLLTIVQNSVP